MEDISLKKVKENARNVYFEADVNGEVVKIRFPRCIVESILERSGDRAYEEGVELIIACVEFARMESKTPKELSGQWTPVNGMEKIIDKEWFQNSLSCLLRKESVEEVIATIAFDKYSEIIKFFECA